MRVQISPEAADSIRANGGQVWIWAARPRVCCSGAPAWMHAATTEPEGVPGFTAVELPDGADLHIHFRPVAGLRPDVLEIGVTGRRRPRVAAYWDGCLMAMV
jgi:hypothetical protein